MKILIDTNVILDVLCSRNEFLDDSLNVWKLCEIKKAEGYISALSVPNIVYIMRKELTPAKTQELINQIAMIFQITDLRPGDLVNAANMHLSDYEDAIQISCAQRIKADYIITRNVSDFKESTIPVLKPYDFLKHV